MVCATYFPAKKGKNYKDVINEFTIGAMRKVHYETILVLTYVSILLSLTFSQSVDISLIFYLKKLYGS